MFTVVLNASSVGRGLATKYFTQIVTRYAKHDCVLLWELGNELNLQVNLPPPKCHPTAKCFGHKAMTAFTAEMVGIIRSIDPRRPISSGFSSPRAGAWHMEHCEIHGCPAGVAGGFWGPDTKEQWQEALAEQQKGTDYWSIHLYDDLVAPTASSVRTNKHAHRSQPSSLPVRLLSLSLSLLCGCFVAHSRSCVLDCSEQRGEERWRWVLPWRVRPRGPEPHVHR